MDITCVSGGGATAAWCVEHALPDSGQVIWLFSKGRYDESAFPKSGRNNHLLQHEGKKLEIVENTQIQRVDADSKVVAIESSCKGVLAGRMVVSHGHEPWIKGDTAHDTARTDIAAEEWRLIGTPENGLQGVEADAGAVRVLGAAAVPTSSFIPGPADSGTFGFLLEQKSMSSRCMTRLNPAAPASP